MTRPPAQRPRPRWGRFITLTGFLTLCASCFLPQAEGCNEPIVPINEAAQSGGLFLLYAGLPFLAAIILTPFYAIHAFAWLIRSEQARRVLALVLALGALAFLLPGMLMVSWMAFSTGWDGWIFVAATASTATVSALIGLARRPADRKAARAVLAAAVAAGPYFCLWLSGGHAMYGLWVSIAGCVLIAIGSVVDWFQSPPPRAGPGPPGGT